MKREYILFRCGGEAIGKVEAGEGSDLIFIRELWLNLLGEELLAEQKRKQ